MEGTLLFFDIYKNKGVGCFGHLVHVCFVFYAISNLLEEKQNVCVGGGGGGVVNLFLKSHFMFSSRFMLFPNIF